MRTCFDKRVLLGLGVVVLALFVGARSSLGTVAPLLILAACPLSMVFMVRAMNRDATPAGKAREDGRQGDLASATQAKRSEPERGVQPTPGTPRASLRSHSG